MTTRCGNWGVLCLAVAFLGLASGSAVAQQAPPEVAALIAGPARMQWQVLVPNEGTMLRVSGPYGEVEESEFAPQESPTFELTDRDRKPRPDGVYTWELRARPVLSPGVRRELEQAREAGDETVVLRLRHQGLLPRHPLVQSGAFSILGGSFVAGGMAEGDQDGGLSAVATPTGELSVYAATTVISGDLSVNNSLCVGLGCTDAESFGFDTIRLKEDNTRVKFQDTSSMAGFPTNDWQLTANDSASGGLSKFSIEDIDNARVPFTIEAAAPSNSLYVDDGGRVGLGTATPVLDVHIRSNNTPSLRLEQDNSGGFTAQTWDVTANEANFFIRDVSYGSRLPFRIGPNAPTNTLTLKADGKVGIGTWSPYYTLDIPSGSIRAGGGVFVGANAGAYTLDFLGDTGSDRNIFRSGVSGYSNGFTVQYRNSPQGMVYAFINGNVGIGTATPSYPLHMSSGAHVTAGGVWTNASSRSFKQNIVALDGDEAVAALASLDPVKFEYKADPSEKHVGFIAEDVPALLATGDRTGLSPMDIVAVLTKVVQEQQKTISDLRTRVASLEVCR